MPAGLRLTIEYKDPRVLKAAERQLRRHGAEQIAQLARNLLSYGCVLPILLGRNGRIIAGHAVYLAAVGAGLAEVPVVAVNHLSEAEESALRISLNRLQELSTWDEVALKTEISLLSDIDLGLVGTIGFTTPEIDVILNPVAKTLTEDPADRLPLTGGPIVSRSGDMWLFEGGHRLLCADALVSTSYDVLLAGEKARLAACDLPYNVRMKGHASGRPGTREFAMASGEMSPAEFTGFLRTIFEHLVDHSLDGALHLQFMDWRHIGEMLEAGHAVYDELKNLCVWAKSNAGMGSLWRSQHELCFVWKTGTAAHTNNVELGRHGRHRSNLWPYPGANGFRPGRKTDPGDHPTPKCVAMLADAMLDVSAPGEVVLDPTAGSGTTLVAAHRTRRRAFAIEIDPSYVDSIVRRMEVFTGVPARHAEAGLTFAETAVARAGQDAQAGQPKQSAATAAVCA